MQSGKSHRARRSPVAKMLQAGVEAEELREQNFAEIQSMVLRETRADLTQYRTELVATGVARQMARHNIESIPDYVRYVRQYPREAGELLDEIRPHHNLLEPGMREALRTALFSSLWKERRPGDSFRAWVPNCGSGEEAYSIAITVLEILEQTEPRGLIQVFGTDLDGRALETARRGIYTEERASQIAGERRHRFFRQENSSYQVQQEIRDLCIFGRHDVSKEPPLTRMDLVVFRNQLGAFTGSVQDRLLGWFQYSLKTGGMLAVGQSETLESLSSAFTAVANRRGIYVRRGSGGPSRRGEHDADTGSMDLVAPEANEVLASSSRPKTRRKTADPLDYDDVQALIDEQEKAIESLRLANEEIVASNEELQVTNEELTATREELQAANLELATLNDEMQQRNRMLGRESAELQALCQNIDAAVVRVDADLRIRRFTARAARLFHLAPQDVGRRLNDFRAELNIPELDALLQDTAKELTSHEREARAEDGMLYRITIRPFRAENNRIDGAILTAWPISTHP